MSKSIEKAQDFAKRLCEHVENENEGAIERVVHDGLEFAVKMKIVHLSDGPRYDWKLMFRAPRGQWREIGHYSVLSVLITIFAPSIPLYGMEITKLKDGSGFSVTMYNSNIGGWTHRKVWESRSFATRFAARLLASGITFDQVKDNEHWRAPNRVLSEFTQRRMKRVTGKEIPIN